MGEHNTTVRYTAPREYRPACSCGWMVLSCASRGMAMHWCEQHLRRSRIDGLTVYTSNELLEAP